LMSVSKHISDSQRHTVGLLSTAKNNKPVLIQINTQQYQQSK